MDREALHAGETRAISIISYIITNRITIRDTIINYIRNNTSLFVVIATVISFIK